MKLRKLKKKIQQLVSIGLLLKKVNSHAIPIAEAKKSVQEIAEFFGLNKVPCMADMQKSVNALKALAKDCAEIQVLTVNPEQALPVELSLPFGAPFIVVDPSQDADLVRSILDQELVKKHFIVSSMSADSLFKKLSLARPTY